MSDWRISGMKNMTATLPSNINMVGHGKATPWGVAFKPDAKESIGAELLLQSLHQQAEGSYQKALSVNAAVQYR